MEKESIVSSVFELFESRGHEQYDGEAVSQLQHAVQSAELARRLYPEDKEFIIAAFLHDYGHLISEDTTAAGSQMDGYGLMYHEKLGARRLGELGFSSRIQQLVNAHVDAKRYLVASDAGYFSHLSDASKITLMHQGGAMTIREMESFEADPLFPLYIALRRIDEQAKSAEHQFDSLDWLRDLMQEVL